MPDVCKVCQHQINESWGSPGLQEKRKEENASSLILSMSRVYNVISSYSELKQLIKLEFQAFQKDFSNWAASLISKYE